MNSIVQKYGKKKILYVSLIVILVISALGIGIWYKMEQDYKQSILDKLSITWVEDVSVECGSEDVDYKSFISDSYGDVLVPKNQLDTSKVGKIKVVYKVSSQGYSKEIPLEISIVDTTAPSIKLADDHIELDIGSKYDLKSNVTVTDIADGVINEFKISGDIDYDTAGDYILTVTAKDKAGNESSKDFKVTIVSKDSDAGIVEQKKQESNSSTTTSKNTQSGNTQSNNSQSQQSQSNTPTQPKPTEPQPPACDATQWKQIGNSGHVSRTWDEANSWGMNNTPEGYLYGVYLVHDQCGGEGWTVDFEKQN